MQPEITTLGTILVVDDNPTNISVLYDFLSQQNYEVLIAQDGLSALDRAEYGQPDLILLDVMMPGIDGFETCRRMQEIPVVRDISVIFMTALSEVDSKVRGLQAGAVDYITKPFQQDEVLARIQTHLTIRKLRLELQKRNARLEKEIEERKRVESFLRAQQDLSLDGILVINEKGECISHNRRWLDLWNITDEELKGVQHATDWQAYIQRLIPENQEKLAHIHLLLGKKNGHNVEFTSITDRIFDLYSIPMIGVEGTHYGRLYFLRDISERKIVEDTLRELNANKDRFFSIIAHDLNNPFQGILGFTELLSESIDDMSKEEILDYAQKLNESTKNIFQLLQQLLSWSRLQIGHMQYRPSLQEFWELAEFNTHLIKHQAEEKGITVENTVHPESYLFCDPNMVNTILRNLLSNAVKFTSRGGQITVSSRLDDEWLRIQVKDTGVGMSPATVGNLFKLGGGTTSSLGTKQEAGTGLGLILAKEMIERHGGQMTVQSVEGVGSSFHFNLPRPSAEQLESVKNCLTAPLPILGTAAQ
jgi:two-component system, cell cycle sensor histidine kinase and response regulator CckA